MKLNLGCSNRHLEGFVNVDLAPPADVIADLREPWPWDDSSISLIVADDIFEHLPDKIHTMNEAWRVLAPDGELQVTIPSTDGRGAFQDPTHVSFWNPNSFWYFEAGNPHRERFGEAYGVRARFRIISGRQEAHPHAIHIMKAILVAVK